MHRRLVLLMLVMFVATGCVRYRTARIEVRDARSGEPVSGARVLVDFMPVFLRANANKIPLHQTGVTNDDGLFSLPVPRNRVGEILVAKSGYAESRATITEDSFDDGVLKIDLNGE